MKKKISAFIAVMLLSSIAYASVQVLNSSSVNLGHFAELICGSNLTCTAVAGRLNIQTNVALTGDGTGAMYGYLQEQFDGDDVSTLTAAYCGASIVGHTTTTVNLTAASVVGMGCRYTFINIGTSFTINPANQDQIWLLTNADGDSINANTIGEHIILEAASTAKWVAIGSSVGWSDNN